MRCNMFGLYIHIPYCRSKCRYCDFYSTPCPDGVPEAYIDALCREMDRFSPCGSTPLRPDTLYFGGGTPSLLTPAQAARLIRAACSNFTYLQQFVPQCLGRSLAG